jgi:hypothetical protein
MVAYHGGPFSAPTIAAGIWRKHHAMISFARSDQIGIAAEYASSFVLDKGLSRYGQRVSAARPGTCTIAGSRPGETIQASISRSSRDVIDGSEEDNDDLLAEWPFFDASPFITCTSP